MTRWQQASARQPQAGPPPTLSHKKMGVVPIPTFLNTHPRTHTQKCIANLLLRGPATEVRGSSPKGSRGRVRQRSDPQRGPLTFALDLKHAGGIFRSEAAELTGGKRVAPLAAGGLWGPRLQVQGLGLRVGCALCGHLGCWCLLGMPQLQKWPLSPKRALWHLLPERSEGQGCGLQQQKARVGVHLTSCLFGSWTWVWASPSADSGSCKCWYPVPIFPSQPEVLMEQPF